MKSLRRPRAEGFTILEMLIVCALFSLITTMVALLFTQGTYTYRHGENHLMMQRGGRHLAARVTPYLASMFDAVNPSMTPLWLDTNAAASEITLGQRMPVNPDRGDPAVTPVDPQARMVYFTTTEDWLGPDYPSNLTSSTLAATTADLRNHTYRIRYEDPNPNVMGDAEVLLDRLVDNSGNLVVDESRRLYIEKDEALRDLRFVLVRANLLQLCFRMETMTKSAANVEQMAREEFRYTFNLPTKSL